MFYTVYKIVNNLTQEFYIGVHKTLDPHDSYLGSGVRIRRSVNKYGSENFSKEILFLFDSQEEAWDKEEELVEVNRQDPLCLNLRKGGSGGFDLINRESKNGKDTSKANQAHRENLGRDPDYKRMFQENLDKARYHPSPDELIRLSKLGSESWRGCHHEESSKKKMSLAKQGARNSQYGTCWVTLGGTSKKIPLSDLPIWEEVGWRRGRK